MNDTPTPRTDALYDRVWTPANEDEATEALATLRDFARQLERELGSALNGVTSLAKERNEARAALEALTVRFARVESLYFDLAIKTGTTPAPGCEAGEVVRARELLAKT